MFGERKEAAMVTCLPALYRCVCMHVCMYVSVCVYIYMGNIGEQIYEA